MMRVEQLRGGVVEAWHEVHVAVVDSTGGLVARTGDPELVTFWRSAAKPFQALPLVEDGAAARFGLTSEELALACASHSSEPDQVARVRELLGKIGCSERDLLCGPHPPLSDRVAQDYQTRGLRLTAVYSHCSGKHAGRLALLRHPDLIAGEGRPCTEIMRAHPGRVIAKVGAEGVYCALLTQERLGVALKVADGHAVGSALAMAAVLEELGLRPRPAGLTARPNVNTRGETVGELRVKGGLEQ